MIDLFLAAVVSMPNLSGWMKAIEHQAIVAEFEIDSEFDATTAEFGLSGEFKMDVETGIIMPGRGFRVRGWRIRKAGTIPQLEAIVREKRRRVL